MIAIPAWTAPITADLPRRARQALAGAPWSRRASFGQLASCPVETMDGRRPKLWEPAPDAAPTAPLPVIDATLWTGTFTVDLLTAAAAPAWRLDVVLRRDLVAFWRGNRNLAMIDRDQLRAWISTASPDDAPASYVRHDLTLTTVQTWIAVTLDDDPPVWITSDARTRLRAVL